MGRLLVELVPRGAWNKNLRSELAQEEWDKVRRACYKKAGYCCEICSGKGPKWPVECHEIWEYDDVAHKQRLKGLIALCPDCHKVKHLGFAQVSGKFDEAIAHMMKVNSWTLEEANKHAREAFEQWGERSKYNWELDISWLHENV